MRQYYSISPYLEEQLCNLRKQGLPEEIRERLTPVIRQLATYVEDSTFLVGSIASGLFIDDESRLEHPGRYEIIKSYKTFEGATEYYFKHSDIDILGQHPNIPKSILGYKIDCCIAPYTKYRISIKEFLK